MLFLLKSKGIKEFIFDCGFSDAQKNWKNKFGSPYLIVKNYWSEGSDHMLFKKQGFYEIEIRDDR